MGYRVVVERFVVAVQEQTYGWCPCAACRRAGISWHSLPRTILEATAAAECELAANEWRMGVRIDPAQKPSPTGPEGGTVR